MNGITIRVAEGRDLARITEIYNYYVLNTPVTFDVEAYTVDSRETWFAQFRATGRYRLLVAEESGIVMGYAGTTRFRPKAAYETTVETTIYCAPDAQGEGYREAFVWGAVRSFARRGHSSLCSGICAAECGERGFAQGFRIQGSWRVQREWKKVREVLGRVLGGTGGLRFTTRAECNGAPGSPRARRSVKR